MIESEDTDPYVYNKGQVGDLIFHLPYWDSRTYLKNENTVIYSGQNDKDFVLRTMPVDHKDLNAANMTELVKTIRYYTSAELIEQYNQVKTASGSAVMADFHVTYHGGSGDITALFILDVSGTLVGFFIEEVKESKK